MNLKYVLLVLLVLIGSAAAQTAFGNFTNSTMERIATEGNAFVTATHAGLGTGLRAPIAFYEAFDPGYCGTDKLVDQDGSIDLGTPIVLVIIIVAIGITLIWMLGQILQSPGLLTVAKDEAVQLIFTGLRVAFIIGVILVANAWFSMKTAGSSDPIYGIPNPYPNSPPGSSISIIDAAMAFTKSVIVEMITTFSNLVLYNTVIHTLYTSTMWFGVTWRVQYSFNLGPVLKPLVDIVGMALQFLSLGISEWMLHLITLCIIKRWIWAMFIPLAILLRAIPQTRGAGEALFAISFALALVYPFMFIVTYETHKLMRNNLIDESAAVSSFLNKSGILAVAGSVVVLMFIMAGVFFPFFIGVAMNLAFELIKNAVYYAVILSLLLPFLNIFITLTAAREMAKFFDVDVSFMSFISVI